MVGTQRGSWYVAAPAVVTIMIASATSAVMRTRRKYTRRR